MRPLLLVGHTRALTQIKYNSDGDLLFSCAKDYSANVWYTHNGEQLGTLDGHTGTIWCLDVIEDSSVAMTGSGDNSFALWDVSTGSRIISMPTTSAVRSCHFSADSQSIIVSTDATMGQPSTLQMFPLAKIHQEGQSCKPIYSVNVTEQKFSKITSSFWGERDGSIVTGHSDGTIARWNAKTGELHQSVKLHNSAITDLQSSPDKVMFISSSKDTSARLFKTETLQCAMEYKTDHPVNSAAISPLPNCPYVVLGGGQEAMNVTTSSSKGGFEANFIHMVLGQELGYVTGHFGPINTLAFHPSGRGYASGGEDGYVRLYTFDKAYFDFKFEY